MKKSLVWLLTISLLVSNPITSKAANPVAGAKCTNIGKSQIFGNFKFTCTKSGKQIIWKKSLALPTPNLSSKPSPKATATPTPTPSPKVSLSPSDSQSTSSNNATSDYEKIVSDFQKVSRDSFNKIRENWPNQRKYLTIQYHNTENFPKDVMAAWKVQVENTVNFYDQFVNTNQVFNVYFVTEKDQKWLEELGFWNPENFTHFQYWEVGQDTDNCEGAAAWFLTAKGAAQPQLHGGISISSSAKYDKMSLWCEHVISHEMFHSVQDYWLTKKQGNRGFESRDYYDLVEMPIFREGSADTIATSIGESSYDKYFDSFKFRFYGLLQREVPNLKKIKSETELVEYMKNCEIRSKFADAHQASYFLGMVMFEYAISTYGFEKYIQLLQAQNKETPFREVFKKVYGFEIDEMYLKSANHILNAIKVITQY